MDGATGRPLPPLALTMGEPAGIGGELTLMAWRDRHHHDLPPFFVIDDPARLATLAAHIGLAVPIEAIDAPAESATVFERALPVLPVGVAVSVDIGRPDPRNGRAVLASIERAVELVRRGAAAAAVTNPIQKSVLYQAGFDHPGHTEYLADLCGLSQPPVMMLEGGGLRVVPVTIHLPLKEVAAGLDRSAIEHAATVTASALVRDFGIAEPRLAVAALNPHAGEGGALGREEIEIIAPAVAALRAAGLNVVGPQPADTLFHRRARATFDAAICMYHDQALIPLKTIDFDTGVNITLGLPIVRTSPDHGTALDLAGRGTASPSSLIAALSAAYGMAYRRAGRDRSTGP